MRRILLLGLLILLLAPACVTPMRGTLPDVPAIGGRMTLGGASRMPPQPPPQPTPCVQISRIPCDFTHCGGVGFDFVTVQCGGRQAQARCVANGGCSVPTETGK